MARATMRPATLMACVLLAGCPHPGDLQFVTAALPPGNVDAAYHAPLETTGGVPPLHFEVSDGDFPLGMELDADTGELRGAPAEAGMLGFTVQASDASGARAQQSLLLRVFANPPPRITTTALRNAIVGRPYSLGLQAVDGKPPLAWSKGAGALLPGLTLQPMGALDGSAAAVGTSEVELVVTDANAQQARATFGMAAYLEVTFTPAPARLLSLDAGVTCDVTFQADGGLPPYRYSLAGGALPDGLALEAGGRLSGTPEDAGTYMYSVQVHDESGQAPSALYTTVIQ